MGGLATHFPSLHAGFDLKPEMFMFTQDVQLGVMPIGGRPKSAQKAAVNGIELSRALAFLMGFGEGYRGHDEFEVICEAINAIAADLSHRGAALYELVVEEGNIRPVLIPNARIVRLFKRYVQFIPRADQELWGRKVATVSADDVWRIAMPSQLGGERGYRKILYGLRLVGPATFPTFLSRDLETGKMDPALDIAQYRRDTENGIKRLTRLWGWNSRDTSLESQTEFFLIYKILRQKLAQAILRQHIVGELNSLLRRRRIDAAIVLDGFPVPDEIRKVEGRMIEGSLPYSKVYDLVSV